MAVHSTSAAQQSASHNIPEMQRSTDWDTLKGRSDRPYVFTKCELVWDDNGMIGDSLKAESIRREVEASLRRLQVDVIDLYQIHWPEPDADIEEGWTEMRRLKEQGKVRYIGVSNFNASQMRRAQKHRSCHLAPATLFPTRSRNRGKHSAVRRRK